MSLRSVDLPMPFRPTKPARSAPKLRSMFEKRVRPSGVDHERLEMVMEADTDRNLAGNKTNRRCCLGGIHCCTHPVGIADPQISNLEGRAWQILLGGPDFAAGEKYLSNGSRRGKIRTAAARHL